MDDSFCTVVSEPFSEDTNDQFNESFQSVYSDESVQEKLPDEADEASGECMGLRLHELDEFEEVTEESSFISDIDNQQCMNENYHFGSFAEGCNRDEGGGVFEHVEADIGLNDSWSKLSLQLSLSESDISEEEGNMNQEQSLHLYLSSSSDSDAEPDNCSNVHIHETPASKNVTRLQPRKRIVRKDLCDIIQTKCCSKECLQSLSLHELQYCRDQLKDKGESEQKQFVVDTLRNNGTITKRGSRFVYQPNLSIREKNICPSGWCIAFNISTWRYEHCVSLVKANKTQVIHGNKFKVKKREKTTAALAWMSVLFKRMGDYMPHKDTIHLPHTWTKRHLYSRMVTEMATGSNKVISYEHFTRIWKQNLPEYVISQSSDFTKCSTCSQLDDKYQEAKTNDRRSTIAKLKAKHDHLVEQERKAYHEARVTARRDPSDLTCIIIDGMDQSKTNVPHFVVQDKDNSKLARLPVHFTGVLIHTDNAEGRIPLILYDIKHLPHDSNLTIHCLCAALLKLKEKLGKSLFLQLDNCFRENKNKYVLSFVSLLVELKVFKEAYVHFLPVGHTHEDVDQMFSCVARQLRSRNALTLPDLEAETSKSYSPPIEVIPVTMVQDVKTTLLNHMAGAFSNHSKPLWFRFRQTESGSKMHYKMWVDESWKPESGAGLTCLKTIPDLTNQVPWVKTSLEKTDFEKLCHDLPHAYNSRLSHSAREWWTEFLQLHIRETYEKVPEAVSWSLRHLVGAERVFPDEMEIRDNLQAIQQFIEQPCPDVYIGNQGKASNGGIKEVDSFASVQPGMLAAIHCVETDGRPFIAEVQAVEDESVTINWLKGSWNGTWHVWLVKDGRTNKRSVPYASVVPISSLILWDFKLTQGRRLRQETVRELKAKYEELDSNT